jgi:hypothetical protein
MFEEVPKKRNTSTFILLLELLLVLGALSDLSKSMQSTFHLPKIADLSVIVAGVVLIIVGLRARKKCMSLETYSCRRTMFGSTCGTRLPS